MNGFVVWFTGLSGAGKSTLAMQLASELTARGVHVQVLDGDEVREYLSKGLGFSREDRDTNVRRIGFVARLLARAGACSITAAISPYRSTRDEQRAAIGRFVEVYCKCSVRELTDRDPKGLYKKALSGEIKNFTGVTDPYEEPLSPEIVLDTGSMTVEECLAAIVSRLEELTYLVPREGVKMTPAWGGQIVAARPRPPTVPATATLAIDHETEILCEAVRFGALSPLKGPMTEKDATKLAKEGRLESGVRWPFSWALPVDEATSWSKGDIVELAGPSRSYSLEVTGVWSTEAGAHVAGEIAAEPPRGAVSLRRQLASEGFARAAGHLVRQPFDEDDELLVSLGLEARGKVVLFVASSSQHTGPSARGFVASRGLESEVRVVDVPALPILDAERDPLLSIIALRNLGAGAALLSAPHGRAAVEPRRVLADLRDAEVGIEVVAAGPSVRLGDGGLATVRMARVRSGT